MYGALSLWLKVKMDRRGVTALEYGLIAALIACGIIGGITALGTNLSTEFSSIGHTIETSPAG